MLTRFEGNLWPRGDGEVAPEGTGDLEREGFTVVRGVFGHDDVTALKAEVARVFDEYPPDERHRGASREHWESFRYDALNRSAIIQEAIADARILGVIEPLLGEDCHVIANTIWWQRGGAAEATSWHIDAGPHVPRAPDISWDDAIPYPIFVVGAHAYLEDCPSEAGPTEVVPRSHTSGQHPPIDRLDDAALEYAGRPPVSLAAIAGDVAFFVSDAWHRRGPATDGSRGRMFIQCHYGRRDIAQRLRPTAVVNHLSDEAIARADTKRKRRLLGLHPPGYYDG